MSYVLAGYGISLGTLGLYAARVLWRERALQRTTTATAARAEEQL